MEKVSSFTNNSARAASSCFTPFTPRHTFQSVTTVRNRENVLYGMTQDFVNTYKKCNSAFKVTEVLPQRILTNPSVGVLNNGLDNEDSNLICKVHDIFQSGDRKFVILDLLGTGTFGQVFRCQRSDTKEIFAIKVIKNKPAYHTQGMFEIKIARLLNNTFDPHNQRHIVRLLESFEYMNHICLVFELLSMSLLDVLTQNQFRGLPLSVVQRFTRQILTALVALEEANVIHCDLKPENVLLVPTGNMSATVSSAQQQQESSKPSLLQQPLQNDLSISDKVMNTCTDLTSNSITDVNKLPLDSGSSGTTVSQNNSSGSSYTNKISSSDNKIPSSSSSGNRSSAALSDIKLIDFGSACFEGRTVYSYIQSRFCK